MNQTYMGQNLIRYRFTRNGVAMGMDIGQAAMLAEQRMQSEGLFGLLARLKIAGTPEGAIIVMVDTYLQKFRELLVTRPDLSKRHDEVANDWRSHCKFQAANHVEEFRNRFYPGRSVHPFELRDYVAYRIELEMRHLHNIEASEMGLDHEAIFHMVDMVKQQVLGLEDRPQHQPPIPKRTTFGRRT